MSLGTRQDTIGSVGDGPFRDNETCYKKGCVYEQLGA